MSNNELLLQLAAWAETRGFFHCQGRLLAAVQNELRKGLITRCTDVSVPNPENDICPVCLDLASDWEDVMEEHEPKWEQKRQCPNGHKWTWNIKGIDAVQAVIDKEE